MIRIQVARIICIRLQDKDEKLPGRNLVYVDGLLMLGSNNDGEKWVRDKVKSLLKLTDLGEATLHFGVAFERLRNVIRLRQAEYCKRVFECFGLRKKSKHGLQLLISLKTCSKER